MRIPTRPPLTSHLWSEVAANPQRLGEVLAAAAEPSPRQRYLHWDKLIHCQPPAGLSHREWWLGLKIRRQSMFKQVPLLDTNGQAFRYVLTDPIPERLHETDLRAGGHIQMAEQITNPEMKDRYYVGSLIEEAITSSQLEGAATTRQVAKEMIRTGRSPRDRSERMILNNYRTMQRIGKWKAEPLTRDLVFEIHRAVTENTLDDPSAAGRFRRAEEQLVVGTESGEVFHEPPPAEQLEQRMADMCDFANGETPSGFLHPVIRSIILHFWLAYDHPFVDGNGRTARALFYWSMLRHGFWLFEFISVSQIILKGPAKYQRAFLYTETDENDLTYFALYHLEVIRRAVDKLHEYVDRKTRELKAVEAELRGVATLNHRQRALIGHALRHPFHRYAIRSHQASHNVAYQTARTDLLDLADRGLLSVEKVGKTFTFSAVEDLEERLRNLS